MIDSNREIAYKTLLNVETKDAYSSAEILDNEKSGQDTDGRFIRRLVYGVLENKLRLDYIINKLVSKGIEGVDKRVLIILRMGIFQLEAMDSVPEYAAINTSVELAKKFSKGREGFVNAVLRRFVRESDIAHLPDREESFPRYLSLKYSIDESIINKWIDEFGDDAERLADGFKFIPSLCIRVNTFKTSISEVRKELEELGFKSVLSKISERSLVLEGGTDIKITETDLYKDGKISIQSQESTYIADLVDPSPGESVLDVCAAPGGKTLAISEGMKNKGEVLAWDIHEHRVKLIEGQMARLGIDIVKTEVWDATKSRSELLEKYDKVLVDAPCSGYGVMGRKPEIRYRGTKEVIELPSIQRKILDVSSKYTKKNGLLIYSTCTINRDENQRIIEEFLTNNQEYSLIEERQLTPLEGYNGFYVAVMKNN